MITLSPLETWTLILAVSGILLGLLWLFHDYAEWDARRECHARYMAARRRHPSNARPHLHLVRGADDVA